MYPLREITLQVQHWYMRYTHISFDWKQKFHSTYVRLPFGEEYERTQKTESESYAMFNVVKKILKIQQDFGILIITDKKKSIPFNYLVYCIYFSQSGIYLGHNNIKKHGWSCSEWGHLAVNWNRVTSRVSRKSL